MGKVDGKFVIILEIARVLSVDEMAVLANVGQASPAQIEATA
jgi:purine-binding chemotaxis protein CheW